MPNKKVAVTYAVGIVCAFGAVLTAQEKTTAADSPGKTSADVLRGYGVDLSEPSLIAALRSPTPKIRVLAAHQLARDHDADAIPALKEALAEEKELMSRIGIATALAALHDPDGIQSLENTCANTATPETATVTAVQMIQMLGVAPVGCASALLTRLEDPSSIDYRDSIIPLLASLHSSVPSEQAAQIVCSLQIFLAGKRQQASVRIAAAIALGGIGDSSSVPILEKAASEEKDPVVLSILRNALESLQKKAIR